MPPDGSLASCYGNQHFSQLKTFPKILKFVDCEDMKHLKTMRIQLNARGISALGKEGAGRDREGRKRQGHISVMQTPE